MLVLVLGGVGVGVGLGLGVGWGVDMSDNSRSYKFNRINISIKHIKGELTLQRISICKYQQLIKTRKYLIIHNTCK